jgi:hypothetical protein
MGRYEPLKQFLDKRSDGIWQANFADVEQILGFGLPSSAYRYPAWWANQRGKGHSQVSGWRSAGWRTCKVDLVQKQVTFERERLSSLRSSFPESLASNAFAVRGAIEFLVGLGGTMPDYQPAPRS